MINVRKGTAHSLQQTDFVGTLDPTANSNAGITAGQLVYKDTSGKIQVVTKLNNATRQSASNLIADTLLVGFAVTNQDEGDAIESNSIGVYALDGGSVIETDQFTGSYTIADIGKPVVQDASTGSDGNVTVVTSAVANATIKERILGYVYDAPRVIYVGQTPITVLPIKLKS